jgi:NitT/TauT family transport system substrate-binding protein
MSTKPLNKAKNPGKVESMVGAGCHALQRISTAKPGAVKPGAGKPGTVRPGAVKIGSTSVALAVLAGLSLAACGSSSNASAAGSAPVTVHLGYFPNLTHAPALVGVAQGIFAKDLGSDKLDASQTFSAGPAENQALLSGSIDIAFEGPSAALSAYSSSNGAVKIIAGAASGGAGLVTKPSITSPSQLKGKTLASPQLANTQDVALRYWLKQQGYSTTSAGGGDVSVQPSSTGNGTIVTEFKGGSIDGAWVPEPYESQLIAGGGHLLVDESSLWPQGEWATTNVVVRTAFLQQHPATVKRFLKGLIDTLAFMSSNPTAAQASFNQQLGTLQGGKQLSSSLLSTAWNRLKFTADPLASTLQTQVQHGVAVGLLKQPSNLAGIYSLSALNSVLKAAGQQQVQGL